MQIQVITFLGGNEGMGAAIFNRKRYYVWAQGDPWGGRYFATRRAARGQAKRYNRAGRAATVVDMRLDPVLQRPLSEGP